MEEEEGSLGRVKKEAKTDYVSLVKS